MNAYKKYLKVNVVEDFKEIGFIFKTINTSLKKDTLFLMKCISDFKQYARFRQNETDVLSYFGP